VGHKDTAKDTARVLGRMYDAIEYRGFAQDTAEELARWAGVPVYNGLTDESGTRPRSSPTSSRSASTSRSR
jgi:ornithine carbamoyltransferase